MLWFLAVSFLVSYVCFWNIIYKIYGYVSLVAAAGLIFLAVLFPVGWGIMILVYGEDIILAGKKQ